jgi:hypothetical protein
MMAFTDKQGRVSLPGEKLAAPPPFLRARSASSQGLMEVTSNIGVGDCARTAGAFRRPTAATAARAVLFIMDLLQQTSGASDPCKV